MKQQLDLSVIIVSYNTRLVTLKCLRSIFEYTRGLSFEVIVVDNGSSDGSTDMLRRFKRKNPLRLIASKKNLGFGRANNRGAKIARGKYLVFLNSDTLLTTNSLKISLEEAKKIKLLGAYSCRLLNADGTIQPTGGFFPTPARILTWQLFLDDLPLIKYWFRPVHPTVSWYGEKIELDWLTGAFMLIPRKIFALVHGFDEDIFMYVEDTDLCYRLRQLGRIAVYSPTTAIIHLGGASGSNGNSLVAEAKQTAFFVRKHFGSMAAFVSIFLIKLGSLLRWVLFGIIIPNETKAHSYRQILFSRF